MPHLTIDVYSASTEAQLRRNRIAECVRRHREKRGGKSAAREERLDLLELRVISYLKYGGTFAPGKSPRRCDYIGKSLEEISNKLSEVECRLRTKIIEELLSRGHMPANDNKLEDYELDVLEQKLLEVYRQNKNGP